MAVTARDRPILPIGSFHPPELLGRPAAEVLAELVWQDPERVSGAPCFRGTRLPVYLLFESLREGSTLEAFCEDYLIEPETVQQFLNVVAWLVLEQKFPR